MMQNKGDIIEDGVVYTFGYMEDTTTLLFFDEDGVVTEEWILEESNGVILVTESDTGETRVLAKISEVPEIVEGDMY